MKHYWAIKDMRTGRLAGCELCLCFRRRKSAADYIKQMGWYDKRVIKIKIVEVKKELPELPAFEIFQDPSYYNMWGVRSVNDKSFENTLYFDTYRFALNARIVINLWLKLACRGLK